MLGGRGDFDEKRRIVAAHVRAFRVGRDGDVEALLPVLNETESLRAVWLHDALRDATPATLDRWAADAPGPAELRHGPASAACAEAHGERDRAVLDAVRYHSVGHAGWKMPGRVLYCADYLEPGRPFDRERRRELARRFPDDPASVVGAVAADRIAYVVRSGWPLLEPTVDFWNSLVAPSASR